MKKRLTALLATVAITALTFALTGLSVSAGVRNVIVSSGLITRSGKFNIAEWQYVGEGAGDVYQPKSFGKVFRVADANSTRAGWFAPAKSLADKKDVAVAFDLVEFSGKEYFHIHAWKTGYLSEPDWGKALFLKSFGNGFEGGGGASILDGAGATLTQSPFVAGYRYKFVCAADGSLKLYRSEIKETYEDGDYTLVMQAAGLYTVPENGPYYFGIRFGSPAVGEGAIAFDNFEINAADGTEIFPLYAFDDASRLTDNANETVAAEANAAYVRYDFTHVPTDISELAAVKPTDGQRVATYTPIAVDENMESAFDMSGQIQLRALPVGTKAGFAFGIPEDAPDTALTAAGVSYLYFEKTATTTQVNMMKDGVAGTPVELGSGWAEEDFTAFTVTCDADGNVTLRTGDKSAAFPAQNVEGLVEVAALGSNAEFALKPDLTITAYAYREGSASIANNFNTGYINPDNWLLQYVPGAHAAPGFADPAEAKGLHVADGLLKWEGTSTGAAFDTINDYSDFILNFDYISYSPEEHPQLSTSSLFYGGLGLTIGKKASGGNWAAGAAMIAFFDYDVRAGHAKSSVQLQVPSFRESVLVSSSGSVADGMFDPLGKTVRYKVVSRRNTVTVYGAVLTPDTTAADYCKIMEIELNDTYGKIGFATGENGYLAMDNIRITKTDGWTDEQYAAFQEDFTAIPDEEEPEDPTVSVSGITLNKNELELTVGDYARLSATVSPADATNKTVTWTSSDPSVATVDETGKVVAVKAGTATITATTEDGGKTAACTVTVTAEQENPTPPAKKKGCGCGSASSSAAALGVGLTAAGVFVIRRRHL